LRVIDRGDERAAHTAEAFGFDGADGQIAVRPLFDFAQQMSEHVVGQLARLEVALGLKGSEDVVTRH
jgi:hypothetical protein